MSLIGLFSAVQGAAAAAPGEPTSQEKQNWYTGTGNVDNTAVARRSVRDMIATATGLDPNSEIFFTASLADDLAMTYSDPETADLITAMQTGFPKVHWQDYDPGTIDWANWFNNDFNSLTVEDICYVWADAENGAYLFPSPPTLTEKNNWLNGTGNVDATGTARRNIKTMLAAQLGVDESEILITSNLVDDLGADNLDFADLETAFNGSFPKIDWATYTTLQGGLSDWSMYLEVYHTVDDLCQVWADAENRGKVLIA